MVTIEEPEYDIVIKAETKNSEYDENNLEPFPTQSQDQQMVTVKTEIDTTSVKPRLVDQGTIKEEIEVGFTEFLPQYTQEVRTRGRRVGRPGRRVRLIGDRQLKSEVGNINVGELGDASRGPSITSRSESEFSVRRLRPTREQKQVFAEFFEKHQDLARGTEGKHETRQLWRGLAVTLNSLGGCHKDWMQWRKFWLDKKHTLRTKVAQARRSVNAPTDRPSSPPNFANWELRMVNILGSQLSQGYNNTGTISSTAMLPKEEVVITSSPPVEQSCVLPLNESPPSSPLIPLPSPIRVEAPETCGPWRERNNFEGMVDILKRKENGNKEMLGGIKEALGGIKGEVGGIKEALCEIKEEIGGVREELVALNNNLVNIFLAMNNRLL